MTHVALLALIYIAFISLGLPDGVLGVAWPSMCSTFGQPLQAAGLVTLIVSACSTLSSLASGAVLKRGGIGPVQMFSGVLTGLALLGYALAPSFAWILLLAVPLGLGAGSVDAGLNHFVAEHYSSRHMNWLHGCWGIGATLGPFIMGSAVRWAGRPATTRLAWSSWHWPCCSCRRWMAALTAAVWVACFFGAIMVGRFAIGLVAMRLGNRKLVRTGLVSAIIGAALFSVDGLPDAAKLAQWARLPTHLHWIASSITTL